MPATKKSAPTSIKSSHQLGIEFEGGFLAGYIYDDLQPYALVVAPEAEGEKSEIAWGETDKLLKAATSYSNGPANTAAMAKAGSAVAKWALDLKIGGFCDWYLPSRLESLILFGELAPLKAFRPTQPNGFAREWYWTSTQHAGNCAYAWLQSFHDGYQDGYPKSSQLRARAIRRISL